jgi:hypothetical protein
MTVINTNISRHSKNQASPLVTITLPSTRAVPRKVAVRCPEMHWEYSNRKKYSNPHTLEMKISSCIHFYPISRDNFETCAVYHLPIPREYAKRISLRNCGFRILRGIRPLLHSIFKNRINFDCGLKLYTNRDALERRFVSILNSFQLKCIIFSILFNAFEHANKCSIAMQNLVRTKRSSEKPIHFND